MEIYIEKIFLDDFYLNLNDPPTKQDECLLTIFSKYGDANKYIDVNVDSAQNLENLKNDNPVFSSLFDAGSLIIKDSDLFFKHIKTSGNTNAKLVFCHEVRDWFVNAEKFGCVCFSFENYSEKIKNFLDFHFELSFFIEKFEGWSSLQQLSLFPNNDLFLNDDFILTDKQGQKIDDNIIPLFKNILPGNSKTTAHIFTENFNAKPDTSEKRTEKAKKVYQRLIKNCSNSNNEFVIYSKSSMPNPGIVLHGRTVLSNYFKIYSPKGLNLMPFKKSNEIFRVKTIFDKRTYMELKEELKIYKDWLNKSNSDSWSALGFIRYPAYSKK